MKPLPSFSKDFAFRGATLRNSGRGRFLSLKSHFLVVDVVRAHLNSSMHSQVIYRGANGGGGGISNFKLFVSGVETELKG